MLWITRVFDNASKIHELEIQTSYTKYYTPLHAPWSINLAIIRSSTHPCSTQHVYSWHNLLGVQQTSTRHVCVRFEACCIRVGFKVSTLGLRCSRWVWGVCIGFEVFASVERKGWNEFTMYHLNRSFPSSSLSHIFLCWVKMNWPTSSIHVIVIRSLSLLNLYCCCQICIVVVKSASSSFCHCEIPTCGIVELILFVEPALVWSNPCCCCQICVAKRLVWLGGHSRWVWRVEFKMFEAG